jgi:hypothetical protein
MMKMLPAAVGDLADIRQPQGNALDTVILV